MDYSEESHDHEHYAFFRAHLQDQYEQEIDYMLDKTIVAFDRICKVPVLLSMLVIALDVEDDEQASVPRDLFGLYEAAITKAVRRWFKTGECLEESRVSSAIEMLRKIACANQSRPLASDKGDEVRTFTEPTSRRCSIQRSMESGRPCSSRSLACPS